MAFFSSGKSPAMREGSFSSICEGVRVMAVEYWEREEAREGSDFNKVWISS